MTREEAIERIKSIKSLVEKYDDVVALRMAIKSLEQGLCEDCISREAVRELFQEGDMIGAYIFLGIDDLPSVKPKEQYYKDHAEIYEKTMNKLTKAITDQEPKTGHWIVDGSVDCYLDKVRCHCSECGKKKNFPADYNNIKQELFISYKYPELIDNYCPNCGARMSEVEE